jgi:hypothetical protein
MENITWIPPTPAAAPWPAATPRGRHACQRTSGGCAACHRCRRWQTTTKPRGRTRHVPTGVGPRWSRAVCHRVSQAVSLAAVTVPRDSSGWLRPRPSPDSPGRCCSSVWCPAFCPASRRSGKGLAFWLPPLSRASARWRLHVSAFRARRAAWLSNSWECNRARA